MSDTTASELTFNVFDERVARAERPRRELPATRTVPSRMATDTTIGGARGFWQSTYAGQRAPADAAFLPAGAVKHIPADTTVQVRSRRAGDTEHPYGWTALHFQDPGEIEGPLLWGACGPIRTNEAETAARESIVDQLAVLPGLYLAAVLGPIGCIAAYFGVSYGIEDGTEWGRFVLLTSGLGALSTIPLSGLAGIALGERRSRRVDLSRFTFKPKNWAIDSGLPLPHLLASGAGRDHADRRLPDDELDQALTAYDAKRAELTSTGTSGRGVDHTAHVIVSMVDRIRQSPRLLQDQDLRTSLLSLVRRAESDIAAHIRKQDATASAGLLAEIRALEKQLDHQPQKP